MEYFQKGIIYVISDILSLITILSCLVIKVPQIKMINELKSARGISLTALLLELFSYSVMMSYNYLNDYSIMSYMEYPILLFQEYILIFLVLKYQKHLDNKAFIGSGIYVVFLSGFLLKIFPRWMLALLVPFCTPIGATSKVLQLIAIIRTKDSQTVSLTTWFISALTNLTRIYTIYFDSADKMLLSNFSISFLLSSSVYVAAWFFKKPKSN